MRMMLVRDKELAEANPCHSLLVEWKPFAFRTCSRGALDGLSEGEEMLDPEVKGGGQFKFLSSLASMSFKSSRSRACEGMLMFS